MGESERERGREGVMEREDENEKDMRRAIKI